MVLHSLSKRAHINSWAIERYGAWDISIQWRRFGFKGRSLDINFSLLLSKPLKNMCLALWRSPRRRDTFVNTRLEAETAWLKDEKRPHSRRASVPQQFLCFAGGAGSESNGQIGEQHHKVPARPETGNLAARLLPLQKKKKKERGRGSFSSPLPCALLCCWHELVPSACKNVAWIIPR